MSEVSVVIPAKAGIQKNQLPEGWVSVPLSDCAEILDSRRIPLNSKERSARTEGKSQDQLFPYYGATGQVGFIDDFIFEGEHLLIGEDGAPFFDKSKNVAYLAKGKFWVNNHAHILQALEGVTSNKYLLHYLNKFNYKGFVGGTTRLKLNQANLKQIPVPIAPPEQQKRIVAKIEELFSHIDAGIEALKKAKQLLKQYRQSVLKAAVTGELTKEWRDRNKNLLTDVDNALQALEELPKPARWKTRSKEVIIGHPALAVNNPKTGLPDGWIWTPLVEIARMESGHTPSRKHPEWWDGDIDWIGIVDARQNHCGVINETIQHTNEEGLANSASRLLPKGTVCVSRTASVGYVVVMGKDMATSQDFVNWVPTVVVTSEWLQLIFIADTEGLRRFGKGTVHKTIYFPEWLSVNIGLPSVEEQKEIVSIVKEKVDAIQRLEAEIDAQLIKAEKNKQSVLASAFSGQLLVESSLVSSAASMAHG